ncbi:MAG: NUDIX domain-containing protein [Patescibacteria group bacterium]|jgi:isopentenyldiphosphate isomerase
MPDELIDIYDADNRPIGVRKMKHAAHKDGSWHRAAHVWIYNSKGEILLQLRAKTKDLYPDRWDISAAGHAGAGESEVDAAIRETREEIGLTVKPEDLQFFKIRELKIDTPQMKNDEFCYVYFLKFDGGTNTFRMDDGEVAEVKFISIDELEADLKNHTEKYAQHGSYWDEVIEEVKLKMQSARIATSSDSSQ